MAADPAVNLTPLNADQFRSADAWMAGLKSADEWAADLAEPFDDVPDFSKAADPEVDVAAGLPADRSIVRPAGRRLFQDFRPDPDALKHLATLPPAGGSLHGVICGRYALWQLIPALVDRTGRAIEELHLATLSCYSKLNAAELLGMLDAGQVKRVSLLISYYFKKTSREVYDCLVPQLLERGMPVLAMRIHAKVALLRMSGRGGARFVLESSANLRSCKNVEQFALFRCPKLYAFHRGWMDELLANPPRREAADHGH